MKLHYKMLQEKSPNSPSNQTALLNSPYTELVGLPLISCLIIICGIYNLMKVSVQFSSALSRVRLFETP